MSTFKEVNAVVVIDAETLPETDTFEFEYNEPYPEEKDVPENLRLKDPAKIAEWKSEKLISMREDWTAKKEKQTNEFKEKHHDTGLVSYKGRIFCISFTINDDNVQTVDSINGEKEMLVSFYNSIKNYKTLNFVGCNLAFDLTFILHRAFHYGLFDLADIIRLDRGWTKGRDFEVMDLFYGSIVWKPKISLDNMCKLLGIPTSKDKMDGSEVFKYYLEGRYDEIKQYCEKDVLATRQIFKILK